MPQLKKFLEGARDNCKQNQDKAKHDLNDLNVAFLEGQIFLANFILEKYSDELKQLDCDHEKMMDKQELLIIIQAELSEQKRWQDLDYGMAAWHEGRASAFKEQLADLAKAPDAADAELKKLGVEIRGLKSNKSKQ